MKKSKRAFTLLELLLAVTIFSITVVALYSSFYVGVKVLRRSQSTMGIHQELRLGMEEISLDLHNGLLAPLYIETEVAPVVAIETVEEEEEEIYFFKGDRKSFSFVTLKDIFTEDRKPKRIICNVTYRFGSGEDGGKLIRVVRYSNRGFAPQQEEELISGISSMTVFYSYAGDDEESEPVWLDRWEQEEALPLGVKIKLKLKGAAAVGDLTKTIHIPAGVLGTEEEFLEL